MQNSEEETLSKKKGFVNTDLKTQSLQSSSVMQNSSPTFEKDRCPNIQSNRAGAPQLVAPHPGTDLVNSAGVSLCFSTTWTLQQLSAGMNTGGEEGGHGEGGGGQPIQLTVRSSVVQPVGANMLLIFRGFKRSNCLLLM